MKTLLMESNVRFRTQKILISNNKQSRRSFPFKFWEEQICLVFDYKMNFQGSLGFNERIKETSSKPIFRSKISLEREGTEKIVLLLVGWKIISEE